MGKWIGNNKPEGAEEWTGFIDQGVKVEGTLEISGTFRVDGHIVGTIRCKDRLIIGEKALVEGDVESAIVLLSGKVQGSVRTTNRLEVSPTGVIEGEAHTPTLVIEAGGVIEGRCHMKSEPKKAEAASASDIHLNPQPQN
jgi:cytoskeletal protein CcmA (bactofilin family)